MGHWFLGTFVELDPFHAKSHLSVLISDMGNDAADQIALFDFFHIGRLVILCRYRLFFLFWDIDDFDSVDTQLLLVMIVPLRILPP